jgi:hypothetical protein
MKKYLFILLSVCMGVALHAQDPVKDMKKAARSLGSYNLDQVNMASKLQEAIDLANSSISDPVVSADPIAWQTYGEIFMAATNKDVQNNVLNEKAPIAEPTAPAKAYKGFMMAAQLADKSYQTKDAMKALADGLQNIYYMGSALYQGAKYGDAYHTFLATYDGFNLLKKNNEPTTFDAEEHNKALYFAGLCAQEAGMKAEAKAVFQQMISSNMVEDPGVYQSLIDLTKEDNPAEAERLLSEARTKFPDDSGLLYEEINHYLAKGELTSLISKLEKAISLEPNNVSVYVTLGQVYDKLYQDTIAKNATVGEDYFNKAMSYYQQAMTIDPKSFDAVYSIGALWYNKAAAYSVELNGISSDYSPAGTKKYEAKKAQMDEAFAKAMPFFTQAEQIQPDDVNTLVALKEIYARQEKYDKVEEYKQKLEKANK